MIYFSLLLLLLTGVRVDSFTLDTYLEWSSVQYQYASKAQENKDLKSGKYIPNNIVILAATVYEGKNNTQIFVTTPDFIPGTPFTLSTVTTKNGSGGPILKPFPNANSHKVSGDCDSITNVWRTKVDAFGRLWVVDNGKENTLRTIKYICPPQILIYDLTNKNKLIRRYKVPGMNPLSVLANVEFEYVGDKKEDIVAYLNDEFTSSLVVYTFKNNTSFVVNHPYFSPDPYKYSFFDLNGSKFYKMIGIDGVALGPPDQLGKRLMYFHPLTSGREASVPTDILRDPSKNSYSDYMNSYKLLDDRGFHSAVELVMNDGTMIFTNLEANSLMTWNVSLPYKNANFKTLIQDVERLQFPASLQIVNQDSMDYLYVVTSRLQRIILGTPEKNKINYRILRGKLSTNNSSPSLSLPILA